MCWHVPFMLSGERSASPLCAASSVTGLIAGDTFPFGEGGSTRSGETDEAANDGNAPMSSQG